MLIHRQLNKSWFKDFFNNYYHSIYADFGIFSDAQNKKETSFVASILDIPKSAKILDIQCGQGRHAVLLAKQGYSLTGVDLSDTLLEAAKKLAIKEKVKINFFKKDMRKITFFNEFDGVINLFSSFGYFLNDEDNLKVLKLFNISLKPKGRFILDLLNGDQFLKQLDKLPKKIWWKAGGAYVLLEDRSEKDKKIMVNDITLISSNKPIKRAQSLMKLYNLIEIREYLKKSGFKILKVFGDYDKTKFLDSSHRMIILSEKIK